MAARLSEDPATRVALIEAGGDDTNRWFHIPLGFGKTFADANVNCPHRAAEREDSAAVLCKNHAIASPTPASGGHAR